MNEERERGKMDPEEVISAQLDRLSYSIGECVADDHYMSATQACMALWAMILASPNLDEVDRQEVSDAYARYMSDADPFADMLQLAITIMRKLRKSGIYFAREHTAGDEALLVGTKMDVRSVINRSLDRMGIALGERDTRKSMQKIMALYVIFSAKASSDYAEAVTEAWEKCIQAKCSYPFVIELCTVVMEALQDSGLYFRVIPRVTQTVSIYDEAPETSRTIKARDEFYAEIAERQRDNFDTIIGITGARGIGKSSLAQEIVKNFDAEFSFEQIAYTSEEILSLKAQLGKNKAMIVDEGGESIYAQDFATRAVKNIIKSTQGDRYMQRLVIICMPTLADISVGMRRMFNFLIEVKKRGEATVYDLWNPPFNPQPFPVRNTRFVWKFPPLPSKVYDEYAKYKEKEGAARTKEYEREAKRHEPLTPGQIEERVREHMAKNPLAWFNARGFVRYEKIRMESGSKKLTKAAAQEIARNLTQEFAPEFERAQTARQRAKEEAAKAQRETKEKEKEAHRIARETAREERRVKGGKKHAKARDHISMPATADARA